MIFDDQKNDNGDADSGDSGDEKVGDDEGKGEGTPAPAGA
jgi:hypothetical protein